MVGKNNRINLNEALVLALQGKLNLTEDIDETITSKDGYSLYRSRDKFYIKDKSNKIIKDIIASTTQEALGQFEDFITEMK